MNWVGLTVGQYSIDAMIAEGSFAWIFRGVSQNGERRAFKVAKPKEFVLNGMRTGVICTKAIKFRTNGIAETTPDARELLRIEYEKFHPIDLPCVPKYFSEVNREGLGYLQMELLEGSTLLQMIQSGNARAARQAVQQAALAVADLLEKGLAYHGDLNPENIFLAANQVKLLDPGYFGELKLADATTRGVIITTPEFYPLLRPDDVLALGLNLWHATTGKPLIERELRADLNERAGIDLLAPETLNWIESQERMGNFYISGYRNISLPRQHGFNLEQEKVLLKSLRLAVNSEGKIARDPGFASPAEFAQALNVFA